MRKQNNNNNPRTETITFDEFIDCITNNKGEEIKLELRKIEPEKIKKEDKNGRKPIKV